MFSVIICTYNGAERLGRVLDCILIQDQFDKYVDELIVVDNCSTDNTNRVVTKYKEKNKKIVYLYESKPGLSNARLCGVKYCSSEWIIFLDDDNFIQENWIRGAIRYINSKANIGAFNGQVIPMFNKDLTNEEFELLKVSYGGLACTTYSQDSIPVIAEKEWMPFGAGLVIKSEPLKELATAGWLTSEGRKGNRLTSGEDTEMVTYVGEKGFSWGFCNDIFMYHEIGEHRLDINYLKRLYYFFGIAHYEAISKKKFSYLRKIKWCFIEAYRFAKSRLEIFVINKPDQAYYKSILSISRAKGYFDSLRRKIDQ